MLQFNELRITPDNKHLIVDVSVKNDSYYKNVVIDSIVVDTQDTYVANGPSSKPIFTYKVNENNLNLTYAVPEDCCNPVLIEDDNSYCFTYGLEESQHIRLILNTKDLNVPLDETMFFVYAIASGTPAPDTPCGFDNSKIMGTVVNLKVMYDSMLCYIRQVENNCEIPKNFIDSILKYKAFELSIRTGNYPLAIKYWNKYLSNNKPSISTIKTCNCYG